MNLNLFNDNAISALKDFDNAKLFFQDKYDSLESFFLEHGVEDYLYNSDLLIEDFELIISDNPKIDAQNAIIIYKAMKNLLPVQAREEKLWSCLCFTKCLDYMKARWPIADMQKQKGRLYSRYFFSNSLSESNDTKKYARNGISRLWWGAYLSYDEDSQDNPYEFVEYVFKSQDLFVGLVERSFTRNKDVALSILKCIKKYELLDHDNMNNSLIRKILKEINFSTGLVMYDALDRTSIECEIDKIFRKILF